MPKHIRSARGEMVDFDLVLIKQQITASSAPTNVSSRADFIENKIRRKSRRVNKLGAPVVAERDLGEEVTSASLDDLVEPEEFQEPIVEEEPVVEEKPAVKPVKK